MSRPPERRLKPAPVPAAGCPSACRNPPGAGAMPCPGIQGDVVNRNVEGGPKWLADCGAARADGGSSGPPGPPYEEEASNHSPVPWLKTVVLNGVRKGVALITSGVGREDERWAGNGPLPSEASKGIQVTSKPGSRLHPGMNLGVTRLLPRWCPAYRQHELGPGSRAEPVKAGPGTAASVAGGERETSKRRIREELSTEAGHAGGLARSSREASACRSGGGAKGRGRLG